MKKMKLFEKNGDEAKDGTGSVETESTGSRVEKAQVKAVEEPKTGSPDSPIDDSDLFGSYSSLVFLSGSGEGNVIKQGDRMNLLEINKSMMDSFESVEFEDFQWICETPDFLKYLEKTGRNPKTWSTNENEEIIESPSRVLNFDGYREESEFYERDKILSYSEYKETPIEERLGDILLPGVTEKGMKYKKKDPDFTGGALTDDHRSYLKFYYTRNGFMYGGLKNDFSTELNLENLKEGDQPIQIFTSYIDENNQIYKESILSFGFEIIQVIKPSDTMKKYLVIGRITNIAPKIPGDESEGEPILEKIVNSFEWVIGQAQDLMSTATGQLFVVLAGLTSAWGLIGVGGILGWRVLGQFRDIKNSVRGMQGALEAAKLGKSARAANAARNVGIFKRLKGSIGKFAIYPIKIVGRSMAGSKFLFGADRSKALTRLRSIRQTGKLRYVMFGVKSAKLAKGAGALAKISRVGSSIAKWSNPLGWVLLLTDVVGSYINYTSDNQAPSWDPVGGDYTDHMKNYAGASGPCPSATNKVIFSQLTKGKQYTMCWTQNPNKGFGLALSFVMSVSTRTTIDMIKLEDVGFGDKILSLFIITNVNSKEISERLAGYDLRLLAFKGNEEYSEGYIDDNISAKLILAKQSEKKEDLLPMAYVGHTDYALFYQNYLDAPDQLVLVDDLGPEEFTFHFEDSESNVINVWGKKIAKEDLRNAGVEEITSFFDKEPVSSYIGDPSKETEEEKIERETIETQAIKAKEEEKKELEKEGESEDVSQIVSKEEKKTNESVLSFEDFKNQKNGNFVYEGTAIEDVKGSKGSTPDEIFQNILNNSTTPAYFEIYFVTLREYADPSLRGTYRPGTFSNFLLTSDAISASDGADLSGEVSVNNYDILLNVKKGLYDFDSEARQKEREKEEEEEYEKLKGGKSQIQIRSSAKGQVFDLSGSLEKQKEENKQNLEKEGGLISKVDSKDAQSLDIEGWGDITNVKAIKDKQGNITKVKIKNRKASLDDKSRTLQKGDPGFEAAVRVYDKYKEVDKVDQPSTLPTKSDNIASSPKENIAKGPRS